MAEKKDEHEEVHDAMFTAAVTLLAGTWKLAQMHGVCPVCLVEMCADMVEEALEEGRVEHGISQKDEDISTHHMGEGTMQ